MDDEDNQDLIPEDSAIPFHTSLHAPRFPGVRLFLSGQRMSQYRYLPLKDEEIRLIALRPTSDGLELSVSFG
jgi:hypothetical protein